MDVNRARVFGVGWVLSILILGIAGGTVWAESMLIESFETYTDTDELRMSWPIDNNTYQGLALTIDLEDAAGIKGPAQHGSKYMRVNYLDSPAIIYTDLGGDDWADYEMFRLWYRGIPDPYNDTIEMRVELYSSTGGSWWGPTEPDVRRCATGPTYCEWREHVFDMSGWAGRSDVDEIRLHVITEMGNAEFYIDTVEISTVPVGGADESWGAIKLFYR